MSPTERHRSPRPGRLARASSQEGSALVEAVIGISLLALLIAGMTSTLRVTTVALERVETRMEVLRAAERRLEHVAALEVGAPSGPVPWEEPREDLLVEAARLDAAARPVCGSTRPSAGHRVRVTIAERARSDDGPSVFEGVDPRSGGPVVRLHLPQGTWSSVSSVDVEGVDGAQVGADGAGCVEITGLPSGQHRVHVRSDRSPLIDRTHVLLDERPVVVRVVDTDVAVPVDVAPATSLTVKADLRGGRPPDVVGPGVLGWALQGDDHRRVEVLGVARAVHPGAATVVVGACSDPGAHASRTAIRLVPEEHVTLAVALATVIVDGIAGRTDAILELVRTEACGDTSRPSLRWVGGLSEGMVIALPAGVWEARLLSASGVRLTAAVLVQTTGLPTRVAIP